MDPCRSVTKHIRIRLVAKLNAKTGRGQIKENSEVGIKRYHPLVHTTFELSLSQLKFFLYC